ncbi:MAG TPA: metallophosphoesterase [Opitutus sp.]|nr:metallophosphoesterase [Opitutus sp.]
MSVSVLRIFSDLHYCDRASRVTTLSSLAPLFDGADEVVFNGDTLDTRPNHNGLRPQEVAQKVRDFLARHAPPTTLVTGNHDPDVSAHHHLEFSQGEMLVTHGDALFEDLVPWGRDAALARRLVAQELARLSPPERAQLPTCLGAYRRAAAAIPQRHQSERRRLRYIVSYVLDTLWPPTRVWRVIQAWRQTPVRADTFVRQFRPQARFLVMGHTHRLGFVRTPSGLIVLNTGAFCPPGGPGLVEIRDGRLALRRIESRGDEYRVGERLAEFALAPT